MKNKNICIIPARSGSKRIPGKNWKDLNGIPIIVRTIKSIQKSGVFDQIYVSTDSSEIKTIVESIGVSIGEMRSAELSDDSTPIIDVIQYEIKRNGFHLNSNNLVACVLPTAVFLQPSHFENAFNVYSKKEKSGESNLLICASRYKHPIDRALKISENGNLIPLNQSTFKMRTQDLPERYYDAGQFYFGSVNTWLDNSINASKFDFVLVEETDIFDIDNMTDWILAEKKMND